MTIPALSTSTALVQATPRTAPVPAPPATPDRGLWTMLSRAERLFFDVPEGTGVLGYGPAGAPTEVAPVVGRNLDVRG